MKRANAIFCTVLIFAIPGCTGIPLSTPLKPVPPACLAPWLPPPKPAAPTIDLDKLNALLTKAREAKRNVDRTRADLDARQMLVQQIEDVKRSDDDYEKTWTASRNHYIEQCYAR